MTETMTLQVFLEGIEGEENAVTADALGERLGYTSRNRDRKVRLMIEDMIFNDGLAVVAGGHGYYTPRTWLEWQNYDLQMQARIREDCKRKAQVKKNVYNHFHGMKRVRMI